MSKFHCSFYIIGNCANFVDSGWVDLGKNRFVTNQLKDVVHKLTHGADDIVAIGIDAPKTPLIRQRKYIWNGKEGVWYQDKKKVTGQGRHCEVVVKAFGLGNPQWTRTKSDCPEWMKLGFELFKSFNEITHLYEVFPSASYRMLRDDRDLKLQLVFKKFNQGPKDMLEACIAAATVYEFINGRGSEVGGGDGLGTIVLPKKLKDMRFSSVLEYPGNTSDTRVKITKPGFPNTQ